MDHPSSPTDRSRALEQVFDRILADDVWQGAESISGTGSSLVQTAAVRRALPSLVRRLGARSMLDVPCGDFHWMRHVDLGTVHYTGADIVPRLVRANTEQYGGPRRAFARLDVTSDHLPRVDLVLCRDLLVHFSYADIRRALARIRASGSAWLLTTVFTGSTYNRDITTGDWRQLNLRLPPFGLSAPHELIDERCTEADGKYRDKALALWRIDELPETARA